MRPRPPYHISVVSRASCVTSSSTRRAGMDQIRRLPRPDPQRGREVKLYSATARTPRAAIRASSLPSPLCRDRSSSTVSLSPATRPIRRTFMRCCGASHWPLRLMLRHIESRQTGLAAKTTDRVRFALASLLRRADEDRLRLSESFDDGERLVAAAAAAASSSKRTDSPYRAGPACGWIKLKTQTWRREPGALQVIRG